MFYFLRSVDLNSNDGIISIRGLPDAGDVGLVVVVDTIEDKGMDNVLCLIALLFSSSTVLVILECYIETIVLHNTFSKPRLNLFNFRTCDH